MKKQSKQELLVSARKRAKEFVEQENIIKSEIVHSLYDLLRVTGRKIELINTDEVTSIAGETKEALVARRKFNALPALIQSEVNPYTTRICSVYEYMGTIQCTAYDFALDQYYEGINIRGTLQNLQQAILLYDKVTEILD